MLPRTLSHPPVKVRSMTTTQSPQRGEQLTLNFADRLPVQLRVSESTRKVGKRGIAAVRAVLAQQSARQLQHTVARPQRRAA